MLSDAATRPTVPNDAAVSNNAALRTLSDARLPPPGSRRSVLFAAVRPSARVAHLGPTALTVALAAVPFAVNTSGAGGSNDLKASIVDATGAALGSAKLSFDDGTSEVKVDVTLPAALAGFHGFHIHSTGQCIAPSFASAGGHFGEDATTPGHRHRNHDGDLPVLLVNADGHARARFDSDRVTFAELADSDSSAFIIHAGPDNYANIPATDPATGAARYVNASGLVPAAYPNTMTDDATLKTGDAGARIACGVIR